MNIFIDESGPFSIEKTGAPKLNCVVAVMLDDLAVSQWNTKYLNLPKASTIKDRAMIIEIIDFLASIRAKVFLVLTDISPYDDKIVDHRIDYCNSMNELIVHNPLLQNFIPDLANKIQKLSEGEYIKTYCFTRLYTNAIRGLLKGNFEQSNFQEIRWRNDNLNNQLQKEVIRELMLLDLSCRSTQDPIAIRDIDKVRSWLSSCGRFLDLTKMRRNFIFISEEACIGIKAADCIANFLRRSLRGATLFNNLASFEKIFDLEHSVDSIHFDKEMPFLESLVGDNLISYFLCSKMNQNLLLKK